MRLLTALFAATCLGAATFQAPTAQANDNVLVWAESVPVTLDPQVELRPSHDIATLNAYDSLYRNEGNPPDIVPWLAESHTVSDDGLTWEFKLRPNVKFHDGSILGAEDVVYSFQRLLGVGRGPAGPFMAYLKPENITKVDDLTVRFVLDVPSSTFLAAIPLVAIVNADLMRANEKDGDWSTGWITQNEAGSGAYIIDTSTYRQGQSVEYTRFEDHFMGWKHNSKPIDRAKQIFIQETSTRVLALLKGEIHTTDIYIPPDLLERIENSDNARVQRDETMRLMVITMNNTRPPFDNVHFRRCLSYAFNYDDFIKEIMKGAAERNPAPIPRPLWGLPADLKGYTYDLEKAKAECDQARAQGAPVDREIELHSLSNLAQSNQAAQLFQSDLTRIGINLRIVPSLFTKVTAITSKPETAPDMWVHWVGANFIDPDNWIGQMYDSQFHGTWKASAFYKNDEVDALLRQARGEPDKETRTGLYEQASRQVVEDAAAIWIYNTIQLRGMSKRLQGYRFTPVGSGVEFRSMSLASE